MSVTVFADWQQVWRYTLFKFRCVGLHLADVTNEQCVVSHSRRCLQALSALMCFLHCGKNQEVNVYCVLSLHSAEPAFILLWCHRCTISQCLSLCTLLFLQPLFLPKSVLLGPDVAVRRFGTVDRLNAESSVTLTWERTPEKERRGGGRDTDTPRYITLCPAHVIRHCVLVWGIPVFKCSCFQWENFFFWTIGSKIPHP